MKHLTLKHCAFHVQIQLHTLTVHAGSVDDWFESYWMSFFFIRCKLCFVSFQFSRLCRICISMKGGKGVDIHFSRLKWSTLKIQTAINKYQQPMITDQLTLVLALSRFQRWLIDTLDMKSERERYCAEISCTCSCTLYMYCMGYFKLLMSLFL